jgi:type VI secretion system protein ImpH
MAGHARATDAALTLLPTEAVAAVEHHAEGGPLRPAPRELDAQPAPMRSPGSSAKRTLRELLGTDGGATSGFGFYAALRRLECHFRSKPRFGAAAHPADEPVRLAQDPSLAFRAHTITSLEEGGPDHPARIGVGFFGAFGPHGPLPTHLTEYAFERKRHHGDGAFLGFLDIFHHRLLSLLYRAWADSRATVSHDRLDDDRFARRLGALIGLPAGLDGDPYSQLDYACLFSAGHFVGQTRHAEGLAKTLRASFGVPARIEELVGCWLAIPDNACWRIPDGDGSRAREAEPPLGVLGESTRVGTEVYDQQSAFSVVLGPLRRADYERFLPGGQHLSLLVELVDRYAGLELAWTLRLVLSEPERRPAVLGIEGRVALTAHLASAEDTVHAPFEDLLIDPEELSNSRRSLSRARSTLR